jgi:hypothetical protein
MAAGLFGFVIGDVCGLDDDRFFGIGDLGGNRANQLTGS